MKIVYGKEYVFLGMKLMYQDDGNFRIDMKPYLEETIKEFGEELISALTPAHSDLFMTNQNLPMVDEKRKKLFHRLVYQLICTTGKGRKDLELAISFLAG